MTKRRLFGKASLATLERDLDYLRKLGIGAEVYLPARMLDSLDGRIIDLLGTESADGRGLSFHAPFIDLSPGAVDSKVLEVTRHRFGQVMQLAEIVKPVHIVFHPGYDQWRYGYHQDLWLDNSARIWTEVSRWGEKTAIRPLLENVFDTRPDHLVELRRRVEGPLGFCFDTGHYLLFSEVSLEEWLTALGEHLAEVHLHDNDGTRDVHMPVGNGDFNFPALLAHLATLKTPPLCVLEHHTHRETGVSLENFMAMADG